MLPFSGFTHFMNFIDKRRLFTNEFGIRINSICPGGVKGHVAGKSSGQDEVFLYNYSKKVVMIVSNISFKKGLFYYS